MNRSFAIKMIDKMGLMEVAWYSRQLRRMAEGSNPKPNESPLLSLICGMTERYITT